MMRNLLITTTALFLLLSCGGKKEDNQAEIAGNAAQQYYSYLLAGDYDAFVDGTCRKDSVRPEYRAQLIENMRMFMAQQKKEHQGIKSVAVKKVDIDSLRVKADVFLILTYGDNGTEQVLLPMVKDGELWYMK